MLGGWDEPGVDRMRDGLAVRPAAVTFASGGCHLATDYDEFLLSIDDYDPDRHAEFWDLVRRRLSVEIHYDSLYGGEGYRTVSNPS